MGDETKPHSVPRNDDPREPFRPARHIAIAIPSGLPESRAKGVEPMHNCICERESGCLDAAPDGRGQQVFGCPVGLLAGARRPAVAERIPSAEYTEPGPKLRDAQSKLTISTQLAPFPLGYFPISFSAPLAGSIA